MQRYPQSERIVPEVGDLELRYRKRLYESFDAPQTDLDSFLSFYNERRAHHGYRTQGRTPLQTLTGRQRAAEAPQAA